MPNALRHPNPDVPVEPDDALAAVHAPRAPQRMIDDAAAQWLIAIETLAAFTGAVLGIVGAVAGALTGDDALTLAAAAGTVCCATVWVRCLEPASFDL